MGSLHFGENCSKLVHFEAQKVFFMFNVNTTLEITPQISRGTKAHLHAILLSANPFFRIQYILFYENTQT